MWLYPLTSTSVFNGLALWETKYPTFGGSVLLAVITNYVLSFQVQKILEIHYSITIMGLKKVHLLSCKGSLNEQNFSQTSDSPIIYKGYNVYNGISVLNGKSDHYPAEPIKPNTFAAGIQCKDTFISPHSPLHNSPTTFSKDQV